MLKQVVFMEERLYIHTIHVCTTSIIISVDSRLGRSPQSFFLFLALLAASILEEIRDGGLVVVCRHTVYPCLAVSTDRIAILGVIKPEFRLIVPGHDWRPVVNRIGKT